MFIPKTFAEVLHSLKNSLWKSVAFPNVLRSLETALELRTRFRARVPNSAPETYLPAMFSANPAPTHLSVIIICHPNQKYFKEASSLYKPYEDHFPNVIFFIT